jgi:AcrR family transcriptional regulator
MGRPRQVTDEQILAEMRRGVLAHGPSVPLDQIAKPLEVSVPALLKRFGSRKALMIAALTPASSPPWVEKVRAGPDDRALSIQLVDVFNQISAFMDEAVPCLSALRESGIPTHQLFAKPSPPERGVKALQKLLTLARQRGLVSATETDAAAFAILGALQTRAFFSHVLNVRFSKRDRHEYVQSLARLFTRALTPKPERP